MTSIVKKRKFRSDKLFGYINGVLILLICVITLYPFVYILANSFNEGRDAMINKVYIFPKKFTLENFEAVLQTSGILNGFIVSILRTAIVTPITVLFTAAVAYALSKKELLFRKFYMKAGLVTMVVSGGLIPSFLVNKSLGLYDNPLVYLFPTMFSFYNAIIFMNFFQSLPEELEEAARMDGASDLKIFCKVVLPLSTPVIATIGLFVGVYNWNDFFYGFIYISKDYLQPIQTFLYKVVTEVGADDMVTRFLPSGMVVKTVTMDSVRYATMIVTTLPIICVYPFLQKYFVKGMMIGAVKG